MTPIEKRARALAEHLAVAARNQLHHEHIHMSEADGIARIQFKTVDDLVTWANLFGLPVSSHVDSDRPTHYWAIFHGEVVEGCPVRGVWYGPVAAPRLRLVTA